MNSRTKNGAHLFLLATAFVVSTYAVSNLMPLLLQIARTGFNISNVITVVADLSAATVCVAFMARAIYCLDKDAGRIRNKVGWFD